jgi:putative transposase
MTKRTKTQWQTICEQQAQSGLSIREFCEQENIHAQTFYSRRHALGLAKPVKQNDEAKTTQAVSQFVQAKVLNPSCTVVLQTREAQLSFSSLCDPLWVAKLLKGLGA